MGSTGGPHRAEWVNTYKTCDIDLVIDDLQNLYQQLQLTIDLIKTTWDDPTKIIKEELDAIAANIVDKISDLLALPSKYWRMYGYFTVFPIQSRDNGH